MILSADLLHTDENMVSSLTTLMKTVTMLKEMVTLVTMTLTPVMTWRSPVMGPVTVSHYCCLLLELVCTDIENRPDKSDL